MLFFFKVSLDVRNKDGMTPLLEAAKNGQEMCAAVLLENGASPGIVDPQTLMNVKEFAEKGKMDSLLEQITIHNPTTPSRCAFPRQPDDDDMRSAVGSRAGSVTPTASLKPFVNQSVAGVNRAKKARTPLLRNRMDKEDRTKSDKNTPRDTHATNIVALLDIKSKSEFLTPNVLVPRTPSPRSVSECSISTSPLRKTKSAYARTPARSQKNPYDLRELSSVLSLYGEQQAPNFRKGFSTPVMTTEEFQDYLEMTKPQSIQIRRSSLARSSISSIGISPLLQQRRRSVLLKEFNPRKSGNSVTEDRRHTICHNIGLFPKPKVKDRPFVRNLSDSCLFPAKPKTSKSNSRRKSLAVL